MNYPSSPAWFNRTWAHEPKGLNIVPHTYVDWTLGQQQKLCDDVDFCHAQERSLITYHTRNDAFGRFNEQLRMLEAAEHPVPDPQDVEAWERYVDDICSSQDRLPRGQSDRALEQSALGRYGE
ncbi:MAG: hypothetical protein Greene041662_954 [Candidatus Peregrinibacteria bacterium Greene0416_62]|nr:MAG: hypothetical protein Greene041662_954 [Candidatus Peregrinibacteria bacterium Greene0416_62]TSC97309.1 MAG: hypothetical protein Greene101449_1237 [Candidatus Peregrinibacteria bacterium Greene1014_49]